MKDLSREYSFNVKLTGKVRVKAFTRRDAEKTVERLTSLLKTPTDTGMNLGTSFREVTLVIDGIEEAEDGTETQ